MENDIETIVVNEMAIRARVDELARQITADYAKKNLAVVVLLNGALIFASDLLRRIPIPLTLDCISVASYAGAQSTGMVLFKEERLPAFDGRDVLVVDDILDTGLTLHAVCGKLRAESHPLSLEIAVLLRKRKTRAQRIDAKYVGFDIQDEFVVGYGLDYRQKYRNLPFIGALAPALVGSEPGLPAQNRITN